MAKVVLEHIEKLYENGSMPCTTSTSTSPMVSSLYSWGPLVVGSPLRCA